MCSCEPAFVCSKCRGTRHDPAYFDPANEVSRPEEAPAVRELRARLSASEQERDKALTTAQVFLAVLPIAFAEVLHDAHTGWLDGREPDFSEETTKAKLREVCRRAGIAEGIPDVPALNARIAAADARAEATEQALRKIGYPARNDWMPGEWPEVIRRMQEIARAALAGREEPK